MPQASNEAGVRQNPLKKIVEAAEEVIRAENEAAAVEKMTNVLRRFHKIVPDTKARFERASSRFEEFKKQVADAPNEVELMKICDEWGYEGDPDRKRI